jgi:hypothetical protein
VATALHGHSKQIVVLEERLAPDAEDSSIDQEWIREFDCNWSNRG